MKKVVMFDMMGVIFTVGDDTNELLIPYIKRYNPDITTDAINKNYLEASLGFTSSKEFWVKCGFKGDTEAIQLDYLDTCLILDDGFLQCASILSENYALCILSNDISEWNRYLRKKHSIDKFIPDEKAFISSDLGLRKPDPEIYKKALSALNVKPTECLFIDDYPERVTAAEKLGITSILFNRSNINYKGIQVRSFSQLTSILK